MEKVSRERVKFGLMEGSGRGGRAKGKRNSETVPHRKKKSGK